jgi:hypothetical protein
MVRILAATLAISLFVCPVARAGEVAVHVLDQKGEPVAGAVVALTPEGPVPVSAKPQGPPDNAVLDQNHETFLPLVTLLRQGGQLTVRNSDTTRHHVYSFSPIKQFQFVLDPGDQAPPVIFDKPGLAAIGCNIHDRMIAYVYAAASPFAALSDAAGAVRFADVPEGVSQLEIWHPSLASGDKPVSAKAEIGAHRQDIPITLALIARPPPHAHSSMDY